MISETFENSRLYRTELSDGTIVHVVSNPYLEELLFDRTIVGADFEQLCGRSARMFLGHIAPMLSVSDTPLAELLILSKGIYYDLRRQFRELYGRSLELNLIATKRQTVEGADVKIAVSYHDYITASTRLLIGDTVASGATIAGAVRHYSAWTNVKEIVVLSFVGTGEGAMAIRRTCVELGIEIHFVYGLAVFGLGNNGFDLSFLHPQTITEGRYVERARTQFEGKAVSCVGWDFGSQAQSLQKYRALCWAESIHWGLEHSDQFRLKEKPDDFSILDRESSAFGGVSSLLRV